MSDTRYPTRMHEALGVEPDKVYTWRSRGKFSFYVNQEGEPRNSDGGLLDAVHIIALVLNPERIIRKPPPGCWHCWNIEAHKIEYVTAVKNKDGRPMNTPIDIPYRYCPSCGRKLEVEG